MPLGLYTMPCENCRLFVGFDYTSPKDEHPAVICAKKGKQQYNTNIDAFFKCWLPLPKEPLPVIPEVPLYETQYYVPDRTLIMAYRGSTSHGTYIKPEDPDAIDDIDLLGICIGPDRLYFGRQINMFEQQEVFYKQFDSVVYEIRKTFEMWLNSSPNVINLFFLRPEDYIYVDPVMKKVLEHPEVFLSEKAYYSFCHYAQGQMHDMIKGTGAHGYMGAKRKELFNKFGFDPKHAEHTIRILRNGIELVTTGRMQVYRTTDADELIAIKTGKVPMTTIEAIYYNLVKQAEEARKKSVLPAAPDFNKAEELLIEVLKNKLTIPHLDCYYNGGRGCGNINVSKG